MRISLAHVRLRRWLIAGLLAGLLAAPAQASTPCSCQQAKVAPCADQQALRRVTVKIDLAVLDETVEVITQSGPYHVPVADLDGKAVLLLFMPRGEVFQGFLDEVIPGSIAVGAMQGAQAAVTTTPAFVPGEYELLLFIDVAPGGGLGPNRGDLAAFDNGVCDPTGASVRVPVGCADAAVTLTNRHFIIF